jgi:probable O-glycosylation ligase (exosortase A-associated)
VSGLRDVLLVVILAGLVPASLLRPWIGVLAWTWLAYMVPHGLAWGFARDLPSAAAIGGATLVGFLFTSEKKALPKVPVIFFLLAFCAHMTLTTVLAHNPPLSWGKWDWVSKELLMVFVTISLFQDRARLRWLYLVIALSLGFYGVKGGLWVLRTGGGERVFGPDRSFFADNNTLGLALCMILPLLLYLSREESHPWLRWMLRITFGLSVIAILFTYSRGAFLGLAVILGILVWRSPWRLRFGAALLIAGLIAAPLAPERLWQRIESITEQDSVETRDTSTRGRLEAWQTALNIALTHPLTGAGFRSLWNEDIWLLYFGQNFYKVLDAHSIFFEVLGEHGFVGLGLYLGALVSTLITLKRLRKRWRGHIQHGYLSTYAEMTQLSLYPFLVAGTFLGVAYFDLYFLLLGTTAALHALSRRAEAVMVPAGAAAVPVASSDIPGRRHSVPRQTRPRHA